jgi:hypothetical protein
MKGVVWRSREIETGDDDQFVSFEELEEKLKVHNF